MKIKIILSFITTVLLFQGCGGGGGSGPTPTITQPPISINPNIPQPTSWITEEYTKSRGLSQIKAFGAYKEGYTGSGVTIAVLDTGVDSQHKDLENNIIEGRDFTSYYLNKSEMALYYTEGGTSLDQVSNIEIRNGGSGFTSAPIVELTGDGTGATAEAIVQNGEVVGIFMTNHGSGYSYVNMNLDLTGTGGENLEIEYIARGTQDFEGHGTGVSTLAAGQRDDFGPEDQYSNTIHGVAFNSKIMPVKVLGINGGSSYSIGKGLEWATDHNAQVQNLSLGSNSYAGFDQIISSFNYALTNNSNLVIAAGNEGLNCLPVNGSLENQCSFPAAIPWISGNEHLLETDGAWIVVGSVNSSNVISSFSNRAGVTKNNFIVAPGENLITGAAFNTYQQGSGTSFAAPLVSGAMALMIEKYPHLKGSQLADIFFSTATDLGEAGVDNIYGHGLINIEKAFSPIGSLKLTTANTVSGSKTDLSKTNLVLSSAFGRKIIDKKMLSGAVAFDSYDRDFNVDLSQNISISQNLSEFNINNYALMNYNNVILGVDELNQRFLIGYHFYNKDIIFSYTEDTFGSEGGEGGLSFNSKYTYYLSFIDTYELKDNLLFKYKIDLAYSNPEKERDSLITNISDLYGAGGEISCAYNGLGLRALSPVSIKKGDMTVRIPTYRNLDGTVGYENIKSKMSVDTPEIKYGPYIEKAYGRLNILLALNFIENQFNIKNRKDTEVTLNANLFF